mgnify:CR=1 FL=1
MVKPKKIAFYVTVAAAIVVIGYSLFSPKVATNQTTNQKNAQVPAASQEESKEPLKDTQTPAPNKQTPVPTQAPTSTPAQKNDPKTSPAKESGKQTSQATPSKNTAPTAAGVVIKKADITSTAKFYPITVDGTYMEVLAVKANDGSIRTALNTCQVCYDSGKGYYMQVADALICQNCKNKFKVDQVELVKGGCNPVPVLAENKTDNGDTITISETFLKTHKNLFETWKK